MNLVSIFYVFGFSFLFLIVLNRDASVLSSTDHRQFDSENRQIYTKAAEKSLFVHDNRQGGNNLRFQTFLTQNYISDTHLNELLIEGMEKGIQGDYQGAISDFTEIIYINPNEVEAYYNRGIAYVRVKDYAKAIADFDYALTLDQTIGEIYLERAKIYLETGKPQAAIFDLNKAKQLFKQEGNIPRYQEVQRLLQ